MPSSIVSGRLRLNVSGSKIANKPAMIEQPPNITNGTARPTLPSTTLL